MGQQGHNDHHRLCGGPHAIEDRAFVGAEGLPAFFTEKALVLLGMEANVALADLASGVAIQIGAEYGCGIHGGPPDVEHKFGLQEYVGIPICFASGPHHGSVWSYR